VPKPVAIRSGATTGADQTLKELADDFGMTNLRSARAGERAAPPVTPANVVNFHLKSAPAWGGQFAIGPDGKPNAMCVPTGVTGKMKGTNIIDQRARYTRDFDKGAGSEVHASWGTPADIRAEVSKIK
jgi:hypothetical protein